jgi:uncharacterized membrane protein YccC
VVNTTFRDTQPANTGWLAWLRRELAPSHERKVRTLILTCGAVLCVIISTVLDVPEIAVSVIMLFAISNENKRVTTVVGVASLIGLTIGVAVSMLLFQFTYARPEWRVPCMATAIFFGMYASRVLVLGPLGFVLGFIISEAQSVAGMLQSPEELVRAILWNWVVVAYPVALIVVLQLIFLPKPAGRPHPLPKGPFVPDAFANPAHVRFALKVTLAAMSCYVFYNGVDWTGIDTASTTCIIIALETTGATLYKGILRIVGCLIGAALALFSILVLIPHMVTLASLVILAACVSAIAAWVTTGTQRIAYAGLQIIFAFFNGIFPSFPPYAPDISLTDVRNRVVGILLGLAVMTFVFEYIWPERATDRLRDLLRQAIPQLARLLVIPSPGTSAPQARPKADVLIAGISMGLDKARRQAEVTSLETHEPRVGESDAPSHLSTLLSQAEQMLALATSLNSDSAWQEWQRLPPEAQAAESELRNAIARRVERKATHESAGNSDENLSLAFVHWTEMVQRMLLEGNRIALISRAAAEARKEWQ